MTQTFSIRIATEQEASIITTHRRAMFEEMGYSDHAALDRMDEKFKPWVEAKMQRGEYRHWFALNEAGEVIAGAGLWIMEWAAHPIDQSERRVNVMNVYTEHAYRKRGLAKRMTSLILDWCRENSITTVVLNASDAGRTIYESLGFRATNEMRIQL